MIALLGALALAGPPASPLRAADFGAVGDGVHDDAPALASLFATATALDVTADASGDWWVGSPVTVTSAARGRVVAGTFHVLPGAQLDAVVVLDLGRDATVEGTLAVVGASGGGAWVANRRAQDGVRLLNANGGSIERIVVDYVRGYAVRTGGGNTIGCSIGAVLATYAGTSGLAGDPWYARQSAVAVAVDRSGASNSFAQRATVITDRELEVQAGDYLAIGGDLVEVVSALGLAVVVYPWPLDESGPGAWPVEVVAGGGVRLHGGNTAAMRIGTVKLQHGGHALHVTSGYGGQVGALLGEVVASTLTVGARAQTVQALSVLGPLHSEIDLVDVLVGGTGVARSVVVSPTQPLVPPRTYQVTPTVLTATGAVHAAYSWPVSSVPSE